MNSFLAIAIGITANACLAGLKLCAGVFGHSYVLIADGLESLTDIFSSLVVLGGVKIASLPPDENHPYGHGKVEPLAALVTGIALVWTAFIIVIQSTKQILHPTEGPAGYTLIVLVIVIAIKEGLFRFIFRSAQENNSIATQTDAWHHRSDAITSLAAFMGISIALTTGFKQADAWAAFVAAGVIFFNACKLMGPVFGELTDALPSKDLETSVYAISKNSAGVLGAHRCLIRKMGSDYYVDLHIEVDGRLSVWEGHEIAHRVKDAIRYQNPRIFDVLVHVEPVRKNPMVK